MEKKFNFVYLTTNIINNVQYVGDHSTDNLNCRRTKNYIGSGRPYFQRAVKEYGKEKFKREILEFFPTKKEAFDAQEKYINKYNTLSPNGYNISPKGGHNVKDCWSQESKDKCSNTQTGKTKTEKTKNKIRESRKEQKLSVETKDKLSKALLGNKNAVKNIESKK